MQEKYILVINAGSATLKFKIFKFEDLKLVKEGIVERIGLMNSFIRINEEKENNEVENHDQAFKLIMTKISSLVPNIVVIGHRVVHGGEEFIAPVEITSRVFKRLSNYNKLAPLHNPVNLTCIAASRKYFKNIPDVAVFDTAFYSTLPVHAYLYAIPLKFYQQYKIRRYGFHGISHQYVANKAAEKLKTPLDKLNLITCHLGSGCSMTAIKNGKAIDTSMGFTPLEGLVMSTRSGSIDPAIPLYLMRRLKLTENDVNNLLNKRSGLFGLSGFMDMREILTRAGYKVNDFEIKGKSTKKEKEICQLTIDLFTYNIKKYLGAYSLILGSVDAVVFTGGIGERSQLIRNFILDGLPKYKNIVIPANEELMIATLIKSLNIIK